MFRSCQTSEVGSFQAILTKLVWMASIRFCNFTLIPFRSYASGLCGAFTAVNMFAATKLYPFFVESLGFYGTFWMYGGVMLLEVIYGALSIPENAGQSLVKTEEKMARQEEKKVDSKIKV